MRREREAVMKSALARINELKEEITLNEQFVRRLERHRIKVRKTELVEDIRCSAYDNVTNLYYSAWIEKDKDRRRK